MEHLTKNFQLVFYNRDGLLHTFKFFALKIRIFLEGSIHIFLNTYVVNNQTFILALAYTIYTGNRLNKCMLLNRLINVNRIKFRHIKTSQPHIYNNGNLKV